VQPGTPSSRAKATPIPYHTDLNKVLLGYRQNKVRNPILMVGTFSTEANTMWKMSAKEPVIGLYHPRRINKNEVLRQGFNIVANTKPEATENYSVNDNIAMSFRYFSHFILVLQMVCFPFQSKIITTLAIRYSITQQNLESCSFNHVTPPEISITCERCQPDRFGQLKYI
jgi:hypothetical protein